MVDGSEWPVPPAPRWADSPEIAALQPRARATRRRLLLAAAEVIVRHGYSGAALRDIADAGGVTKGALYFHFQSKEGLAEALVSEAFASWDDVVARIDGLGLDPLRTFLVYYDAYTARLTHDVSARAALRIVQEDVGRHHALVWAAQWEKSVEATLVRAHQDGSLRRHVDPAWLSRHILATVTGQYQLALGKPGGPSMWERMNDTWAGLLPAVAAPGWVAAWRSSGWSSRPEPDPTSARTGPGAPGS